MLSLLIAVIFLILYCPIYSIICLFYPFKGFTNSSMKHRSKRYAVVHLALFSRIGHLNKNQLKKFNTAFICTLELALQKKKLPIIFRSHLMRAAQVQLAKQVLDKYGCYYRVSPVLLSKVERVGIMCQILLQEWRFVRVPRKGMMVLVRAR